MAIDIIDKLKVVKALINSNNEAVRDINEMVIQEAMDEIEKLRGEVERARV